jgi:hypothetical protein
MSTRHSLPSDAEKRPFIARAIRALSVPIILGWLALTVVVNVVAPQLEEVGAAHSVAMTAKDAPSTIAMMRIGKDFQQFDSDTTAMVLLEGQDKLGDDAHRFYDTLIQKFSEDTTHIEHINNFWGDPLTAAGSQSSDGKAAYVQLNLRGDQGGTVANESVAAVQRIVNRVPPPPGVKAYVTGVWRRRRQEDHPRHPGGDHGDAVAGVPLHLHHFVHVFHYRDGIAGRARCDRGPGQQQPHRPVHLCGQSPHRTGDCGIDRLHDLLGGPLPGGQIAGARS